MPQMSYRFFLTQILLILLLSSPGLTIPFRDSQALAARDNNWNLKCSNAPAVVAGSYVSIKSPHSAASCNLTPHPHQPCRCLRRNATPPETSPGLRFQPALVQIPLVRPRHQNVHIPQQWTSRTPAPHLPWCERRTFGSHLPCPIQPDAAR